MFQLPVVSRKAYNSLDLVCSHLSERNSHYIREYVDQCVENARLAKENDKLGQLIEGLLDKVADLQAKLSEAEDRQTSLSMSLRGIAEVIDEELVYLGIYNDVEYTEDQDEDYPLGCMGDDI